MRSKQKAVRSLATLTVLVTLVTACGSSREKGESAAAGLNSTPVVSHIDGTHVNQVMIERTAGALAAIRTEAHLPDLELNRLAPIARTVTHAQALIDRIADPVERERARANLGLELDRSAGTALTPEQMAIVHRRILESTGR